MNDPILNGSTIKDDITYSKVEGATAAPTEGSYAVGDVVWNNGHAAGEPIGWICTDDSPLTFAAFGTDMGNIQTITTTVANQSAGADLTGAGLGFYVVPTGYKFTVIAVNVISLGSAAGVDADNTAVVSVNNGAVAVATKTFNAVTTFPADLSSAALTLNATPANLVLAAGDVLKPVLTQGTTADLPAYTIQVVGQLTTV